MVIMHNRDASIQYAQERRLAVNILCFYETMCFHSIYLFHLIMNTLAIVLVMSYRLMCRFGNS